MQRASIHAALLLCPVSHAAIAEDYWSYVYKNFDVTTAAGSGYTVSLAHDLARFDKALTRILRLSEKHVPTHIYELPPKQEKRSEEHTSELQSPCNLVCRLLLEKKNTYST